jgi:hypothetical protein
MPEPRRGCRCKPRSEPEAADRRHLATTASVGIRIRLDQAAAQRTSHSAFVIYFAAVTLRISQPLRSPELFTTAQLCQRELRTRALTLGLRNVLSQLSQRLNDRKLNHWILSSPGPTPSAQHGHAEDAFSPQYGDHGLW